MKKFTYDIQREDGGFRRALIRLATKSDKEGDTFDSVAEIEEQLKAYMSYEMYYSQQVIIEASNK